MPGKSRCQRCADRVSARRRERVREGKCALCPAPHLLNTIYCERCRLYLQRYVKAYIPLHLETYRLRSCARRERLRLAGGRGFTRSDWEALVQRQEGRCHDCGFEKKLTMGHLVPLSRGGLHDPSNIIGQCSACNSHQSAHLHPLAYPGIVRGVTVVRHYGRWTDSPLRREC